MEALCLWKNLCSWENQKRKKVPGKKIKKKKTDSKKRERVPFCQKRKKIPFWKRLVLAELHAGAQISNKEVAIKPKSAKHNVKITFPFLNARTSLIYIQKQLKIASNRNVESRLSIRCPAPQHILRSFHFCRYFFLCLKKLCSLLCHLSQCSTERSR